MRRLLLVAAPLALCFGCLEEPRAEIVVDDFPTAAALPTGAMQLDMPTVEVDPGADVAWCYVSDFVPDHDLLVKRATSFQGGSGHHMAVYESGIPRKSGDLFDCSNLESMATMLPMVIPEKSDVDTRILPDDFAVRVPAGTQIVIQAHIINTHTDKIRTTGFLQLELGDEGDGLTEASYWVMSDNEIKLPVGESSRTLDCDILDDTSLVFQLGHMHEWGKSISVTRDHDGVTDTIYSVDDWTAKYRDNGPTNSYPSSDPLVLAAGDSIHLTCTWDNDTGSEIDWPKEMCVTLGAYFPARGDGFLDCNESIGGGVEP